MSFLIEVEDHSNQTVVGFLLVYCSADNLLQISPGFQGLYVCFLCHFVEQDHCRWDCSGSVLGLRGCQPSQSVLCKQYNDRIPNVLADFDCHHSNCQIPNSLRLVLNLLVHVLRFWTWNAYSGMCELGLGPCHLRLWNFSGFASAAIIRLWKRALLSRQRDKRGTPSTLPVVLKQIKSLQGSCFLLLKWCWSKFKDEWVTSHVCSQVLVGGLDPVRRVTYGILCRDVVCVFILFSIESGVRSREIFQHLWFLDHSSHLRFVPPGNPFVAFSSALLAVWVAVFLLCRASVYNYEAPIDCDLASPPVCEEVTEICRFEMIRV